MFANMIAWRRRENIDKVRETFVYGEHELVRRRHLSVWALWCPPSTPSPAAPGRRWGFPPACDFPDSQVQSAWAHGYHKARSQGRWIRTARTRCHRGRRRLSPAPRAPPPAQTDRMGRPIYIDRIGSADLDALFQARPPDTPELLPLPNAPRRAPAAPLTLPRPAARR